MFAALRRLAIWICVIAAFGGLLLVASIASLRWFNPPTTAFILAAEGPVQQTWVPLTQVAASLQRAVILAEDQRFFEHAGVDVAAIRQALREYNDGEGLRGASTITQQVAKNLYLNSSRRLWRKGAEAALALLIDALWSKERILEVYLNIAEFDVNVFGAEAAAEHYFGKSALRLTAREAALLAAALPSPKRYNPAQPSDSLVERQAWILEQM